MIFKTPSNPSFFFFFKLERDSLSLHHSSYFTKSMTASSLWTLLTNVDLSEGELLKFWLIWNAEHIHILPKGLLCILIFYAFYSSKREKKQVEVIEVARCWWHPFHCNDSRDLRFLSRSSLHMNCKAFRLPQQLYILTGNLQEASWSSVPSCLLCIGTLQTPRPGSTEGRLPVWSHSSTLSGRSD